MSPQDQEAGAHGPQEPAPLQASPLLGSEAPSTGASTTSGGALSEGERGDTVSPGALSRLLMDLAAAPQTLNPGGPAGRPGLAPGDRVGRYEIRREVGRGGFGAVYEALDPELSRVVAVKTLRPGPVRPSLSPDALRKEAEAVARLDHPCIVTIFDVGSAPEGPFLVMELLRGETLAARIARGPLALDDALRVAEDVADGLAHAHARGVLHRDLKPANVFVTESGRAKLLDFGIAHLLGGVDTTCGWGTPGHMAPEQARGEECDERSDVYSAGLILGQMLSRAPPPGSPGDAPSPRARRWELGDSPAPAVSVRRGVPGAVARLVGAATAVDRSNRPQDGGAFLEAIRAIRERIERRRRRRRGALLVGASIGVSLAVAAVAPWRGVGPSRSAAAGVATDDAQISAAVTRSLAAYQAYLDGLRCGEHAVTGCKDHFVRAVTIDPTFAMAHYHLAVSTFFGPDFAGEGIPALRQAVRYLDRTPDREAVKIKAFAAWAEGREAEAAALYDEAAKLHPDDFFVVKFAAWFFATRDEPERALPLQRRAVELAPRPGMGVEALADTLSALGRTDELRDLERRVEPLAASGSGDALWALRVARFSRGDVEGALAADRAALEAATPGPNRDEAAAQLWMTRIHTGDLTVEPEIRGRCDYEATYQLFTLLGLAGRRVEALRTLELGKRRECPRPTAEEWRQRDESLFFHASLARFAAGFADVGRARNHARVALERNPSLAPHLAVYVAYAGDADTAAELAKGLEPGSPRRLGYEAVARWRSGDRAGAFAMLTDLERLTAWSSTPHVLPPSYLRGELAAELGDDEAAIASLERFGRLYFYRLEFWSWAYPRSLYLLARSYERAGDLEHARERIARLLALWRHADGDLPLLDDARALGRRLGVREDGSRPGQAG